MYTLVLLIFFFCLPCNSQDSFKPYHERQILEINMIFQIGHIIQPDFTIMNDGRGKLYYEKPGTAKESMQKSRPVNMVIRVTDLNGERKKILTYIIRAK